MFNETKTPVYRIKIHGELDPMWAEHFERLALTHDRDGNTLLIGPVVDHTALYSILVKIRDLNLKLISVNRIETDTCNEKNDSRKRRINS